MMNIDRSIYRALVEARYEDVQKTIANTKGFKVWTQNCKQSIVRFLAD